MANSCHKRTEFGTVVATYYGRGSVSYRDNLRLLAFDRHGIITTTEAAHVGVPAVEVRKLAARGALTRTGYGVYRMTEAPTDNLTAFAEAIALVGRDAVVADESVLDMHELALVKPPKILVATPHRVRGALPDTIRLVRRTGTNQSVELVDGVASMPLSEALIRCKDRVPRDRLDNAVENSIARNLLSDYEARTVRSALQEGTRSLDCEHSGE